VRAMKYERATAFALRRIEQGVDLYFRLLMSGTTSLRVPLMFSDATSPKHKRRGRPFDDARRFLHQDWRTLFCLFEVKPAGEANAVGFIRPIPERERRLRNFIGIVWCAMKRYADSVPHLTNFKGPSTTKRRGYDLGTGCRSRACGSTSTRASR
jgi:hypothetical protein